MDVKGRKFFPIGAYCSPQPDCTKDGKTYPNKITEEQYRYLAESGVNLVYGHNEVIGTETEKYVFAALDFAQKAGVQYLVRDVIFKEYAATAGDGDKWFKTLTDEELANLDARFENSLLRYCNHPAFGGVSFADEPGYDGFKGIAHAKKIFERVCPNKIFYVNMFPYYIRPEQFQFGYWTGAKTDCKATIPEFAIREDGRNIERYKKLYEGAIEILGVDFFSYDAYPVMTICKGGEKGIHEALWELPQYLSGMQKKNGVPFWAFLQAGGQWEGSLSVRVPNYAETSLDIGVPLLYGAKAIQIFPYCFPNDWIGDLNADSGLIDVNGNKTERFEWFKRLITQVQAMADTLLDAKFQGVISAGRYENGLDLERMDKELWSECVFRGNLSNCENQTLEKFRSLEKVEAETQALVGCFLGENNEEIYFVLNNSTTECVEVNCIFNAEGKYEIVRDAKKSHSAGKAVTLRLLEGEFALVKKCN